MCHCTAQVQQQSREDHITHQNGLQCSENVGCSCYLCKGQLALLAAAGTFTLTLSYGLVTEVSAQQSILG
jgi:hypothetical protein